MSISGFGSISFNTQPPKGGCTASFYPKVMIEVSTHSRLKAAVVPSIFAASPPPVSTHSRLKAADVAIAAAVTGKQFQHTAA